MFGFPRYLVGLSASLAYIQQWSNPSSSALELSREYQMYDWVRALLDPTDIVQSPSSAKKQITPPPKFDLPEDDHTPSQRSRSRRSVSPSKKSMSPRKSRTVKSAKDVPNTPSTAAANNSLQEALAITASLESDEEGPKVLSAEEVEVKITESPKKKGRKTKKTSAEAEEKEDEKEGKKEKEEKKADKKKKKEAKEKEPEVEVEITETAEATPKGKTSQTTVSLDVPISLPEVPSAAETEDMITKAKEMVADAIKDQSKGSSSTKKRKPEEDDEETAAESAQRAKKAKVLEEKLKRERVRNRALFGVSAAFALA